MHELTPAVVPLSSYTRFLKALRFMLDDKNCPYLYYKFSLCSSVVVNATEVSASHLQSPTQSEVMPVPTSLVASDIHENKKSRVIVIRQPSLDISEVETIPDTHSSQAERPDISPIQSPAFAVTHSPLPPPPPLPLDITLWASEPDIHMQSFPNQSTIRETADKELEFNVESNVSTPIHQNCTYSPSLPSPPPPSLFPTNTHTHIPLENIRPTLNSRPQHVPPRVCGQDLSATCMLSKNAVSTSPIASGNSHSRPDGIDGSHRARTKITSGSEDEISRPSSLIGYTPSLAPSSPLLTVSVSNTVNHSARYCQASGASEPSVNSRDENNQRSPALRRPYLSAPPLPPVRADAPPQPPRVPLNRGINPRSKCSACNQELGTGDLMIISSMSLYYHLACFVCSRCGIPLSDGLSNAEVRIRSGQLYCQICYPSKHGHQKMLPQGDSVGPSLTQGRQTQQYACSDRRHRQRSGSTRTNEVRSGMSSRSYF